MNFFKTHRRAIFIVIIILVLGAVASAIKGITLQDYGRAITGNNMMPTAPMPGIYDRGEAMMEGSYEMESVMKYADDVDSAGFEQGRMVIHSARVSAVSEDVRTSISEISNKAQELGGFIVTTEVQERSGGMGTSGQISLRVPQSEFQNAIDFIHLQVKRVSSESVSGDDVTEEYTDNEARMRNLEATEEQLLSIMKRAGKVADVLAVQRELTNVGERIERLKARQLYLEESVALSSINVFLSTDEVNLPVVGEADPWQPVAVVKDAVRVFISTAQSLLNVGIWIVVFLPIWGTAYLFLHKKPKRKKK